ncbi:MAG: leucine-rich repeat protein, partial [Lachnospiraceae bacterium]|nr:leucine-rich repeat protein [Lachnospiraceae bacterium]
MKRRGKLFGILLIITALLIMQLPVSEADAATSASDFKMEGKTLVKYRGTETNVSIPDTVEVIGQNAFEGNKNIELVVLPNSVKRIEAYAFWGCENLDTVTLGKGLKEVGDYAFTNCTGLKRMYLQENIQSIGIKAFADCVNMTDISIAPEVTSIHETAFDGCYQLNIHCDEGSIADQFADTFYEKQKEMPEYQDVENYQPENDSKQDTSTENTPIEVTPEPEATIGEVLGTTKIVGNQAVVFIDNTCLEVQDAPQNLQNNMILSDEFVPGTKDTLSKYAIIDHEIVADQAYYRNQNLQEIVLPNSIVEIGQFSFARSSATSIHVGEGVRKIGYGAFYHCDELLEVTLPNTLLLVEPKAFTHTAWVKSFQQNRTEDFLISGGVLVAYCGDQSHVTIPEGVRVIAGEAFMGHTEIQELVLPQSLISVGEGAFEGCVGLRTLILEEGLLQIKDRAFADCPISYVKLPASVSEVGVGAFESSVQINYEGTVPVLTHELTAQRLSNEAYRNCSKEQGETGVQVSGLEGAAATLEGASRGYILSIQRVEHSEGMQEAYRRYFKEELPEGAVI